jgi:hypothetical protein
MFCRHTAAPSRKRLLLPKTKISLTRPGRRSSARPLHLRWPWASPERLTSANRDFQTALDHAHADVTASDATVRNLDAQLALQQPVIEQESVDIAAAEDNAEFRAGTADPLRRIDGDRLRHHSACAADRRRRWASRPRGRSTFSPSNEPRVPRNWNAPEQSNNRWHLTWPTPRLPRRWMARSVRDRCGLDNSFKPERNSVTHVLASRASSSPAG